MITEDIFALDMGTTKFCIAAIIKRRGQSTYSLEHVTVPARGMRRGMLANFDEAQAGLNELIETAERHFGRDIRRVVIGVAGSHLLGKRHTFSTRAQGHDINAGVVQSLQELAINHSQVDGREILHCVPITYHIDGRTETDNPIGFSGTSLQGEYFVIDADKLYMKDIVRLCNMCGLEVRSIYAEPFASASVTVEDRLKDLGIAVADIGGGTTDGIVFTNGKPVSLFTMNVAGNLMTNDIAVGLNLSFDEAEKVKAFFGLSRQGTKHSFQVRNAHNVDQNIDARMVYQILGARVYELGQLVASELMCFKGQLGGGLLLTGGGAEVIGITDFYHGLFKIPVHKAYPSLAMPCRDDGTNQNTFISEFTRLATVYGLLNLEINKLVTETQNRKKTRTARYISHFVNWLKELS